MNCTLVPRGLRPLALGLVLCAPAWARAQTGVDDDRVSLPSGPGSLEGVGDDVEIDPNMGSMSHRIAIDLPRGFPGASPSLALTYSSASGSGPLGIGWSMSVPMVGRMTSRGAPNYDAGDLFDVGGQELVQVGASGGDLIYRARFEKGFVRYRWVGDATGAEGYWVGENPDGSVSYYGADAAGTLVDSARKTRPQGGTAEYCLVETVDPYGHSVRYSYQLFNGSIPLLSGIRWLDDGTGADLYAVEIDYEGRGDVLSDASRGYEEITADRLTRIRVKSGAQTVREYVLAYEDDADAGGFSRLVRVDKYGLGGFAAGDLYPVGQRFQYSQALGADCSSGPCDNPYFVEMSFEEGGASFGAGLATLVDINGDALPDILDTSASDGHRFFINTLTPRPQGGFDHGFTAPVASQVSGTASLRLGGMGRVQTFDVNGDGRSDLLSASTGAWLENGGSGDWSELRSFGDITGLSSVDFATSRFIDIDDDKRVDIINSTASATRVYRNEGDRFSQELVSALGVAFGVGVQFADMNGDGLNDPVELRTDGTVRYRLNLGHGQWSADWRTVSGLRVNSTDVARADFEDLNGDNVSDIVIVGQTQVQYAINRNDQFDAFVTITTADLGSGAIPERLPSTTVLYVDMNANGSQDVVWISGSNVSYLEMFPRRPNLLTQIENGIGSVQRITYTTAAEEMARARAAGSPWSASLQIPMQMAKTVDRYVTLTGQADGSGLHELTAYAYRDGYYDGIEKQYRGFERVEMTIAADAYQEAVNTAYLYDVGRTAPHRSGLALSTIVSSDGEVLNETRETYAECELDEVPTPSALEASGRMGVYFVCNTASEIVHKEGLTSASEWKTVRVEKSYDGYGSVTLNAALGVVDLAGDELYTETTYVPPTSRWLIGLPARERVYDAPGIADFSETLTYYDGEAFAGLPNGQATEGFVSRVTHKVDGSGRTLASVRARRDAHGNSVETIDPNGSLADETIHRRRYGYDETGFFLITTDLAAGDHVLRRESRYERNFQRVIEATQWMLVQDGEVMSNRDSRSFQYDSFGRLAAEIQPGDDPSTPSKVYTYELADPVSRIRMQARSTTNGPLDEEVFTCLDGRGREYQTRTRTQDGSYQVSGLTTYNARGGPVKVTQPWVSRAGSCDLSESVDGVLFTTNRFDALDRSVLRTTPGAAIYGEDVVSRTVFRPLVIEEYDGEDTHASGPHADTPVITTTDGLNRTIAVERTSRDTGALVRSGNTLFYDSTGTFSGYENAEGHRHLITTDLLGRTVQIDNPNLGTLTYVYDDASNITSITDGRGVVQRREYDGLNRMVERYDAADRDGSLVTWHYDLRPAFCAVTECTNLPGQLAAVTYPIQLTDGTVLEGVDRMGYDVRRRGVFSSRSFGDLAVLPSRMAYDNRNRMVALTSPDGTVVSQTYDQGGRVTAIPGYVDAVGYDARGQMSHVTFANRAATTLGYDALMRHARIHHTDGTGSTIHDLAVAFDRSDTVTSLIDAGASGIDLTARFEVDDWYRVTQAGYADQTESFSMDLLDRVLDRNGTGIAYGETQPLAARAMGDLSMGYDGGGYLVSRNGMGLARDELGRIVEITEGGETQGRHAYAATDRVLQMTEDGSLVLYGFGRYEVRDGVGTTFVSVGSSRVARHETTGMSLGFYPDLNANQAIDAGDAFLFAGSAAHILGGAAQRLLVENEDEVAFLHADYVGSHVAATDASGEVRGQQAFMQHGMTRASRGYVGAYGFTGQERDLTTGLVHMKNRDLDPVTGRWDSFDPAFVRLGAGAMSRLGEATTGYAYVANGSSTFSDPSGLGKERKKKNNRNVGKGKVKGRMGQVASKAAGKAEKAVNNWWFTTRVQNHYKKDGTDLLGYRMGNDILPKYDGYKIQVNANWGQFASDLGRGGGKKMLSSMNPFKVYDRYKTQAKLNATYNTTVKRLEFMATVDTYLTNSKENLAARHGVDPNRNNDLDYTPDTAPDVRMVDRTRSGSDGYGDVPL